MLCEWLLCIWLNVYVSVIYVIQLKCREIILFMFAMVPLNSLLFELGYTACFSNFCLHLMFCIIKCVPFSCVPTVVVLYFLLFFIFCIFLGKQWVKRWGIYACTDEQVRHAHPKKQATINVMRQRAMQQPQHYRTVACSKGKEQYLSTQIVKK